MRRSRTLDFTSSQVDVVLEGADTEAAVDSVRRPRQHKGLGRSLTFACDNTQPPVTRQAEVNCSPINNTCKVETWMNNCASMSTFASPLELQVHIADLWFGFGYRPIRVVGDVGSGIAYVPNSPKVLLCLGFHTICILSFS